MSVDVRTDQRFAAVVEVETPHGRRRFVGKSSPSLRELDMAGHAGHRLRVIDAAEEWIASVAHVLGLTGPDLTAFRAASKVTVGIKTTTRTITTVEHADIDLERVDVVPVRGWDR